MDLQLAETSRGGDGGATGARDEGARDVIGKKTEGVVEELIVDASEADENMTRQESGVVGGVGSSLSITLQLQLQEHRLPVGHCQLVVRRRRRRWRLLGAPGRAALASRAVLDEGSPGYPRPSLSLARLPTPATEVSPASGWRRCQQREANQREERPVGQWRR